ncbi:FUSC family protein [Agromyces badenianii]|uniref:FUSC family protein n=1 Tax=Agromyces badenianii TaxID=2080742 RepID=A0A2S0WXQ3_9MICO|nr:FUSC family protein [Agromyces badenianii]AWB96137.1 FUSC family protein [Agromyces badenianii]
MPESPEARRPEGLVARLRSLRALDVEVAMRAAVAAAVPLAVLVALGRVDLASYAAFGGMAAIFGRSEPYRIRMRTVGTAGAVQFGAVGLGILLSVTQAPLAVEAISLGVVIAVVIVVFNTLGVTPSGPLFAVFAVLVCAAQPVDDGSGWMRWGIAGMAAAFAWLLAMSGWLLRHAVRAREAAIFKPLPRQAPLRPLAAIDPRVWLNVVQNVLAALAAGGIALGLGIGHPYWAVVAAIAVIPPARAAHTAQRAVHRVIGTAIGVGLTGLVLWPEPPVWALVLVIAICQFAAELLVGRHYGAALVFVTPLALTVAHLAAPTPLPALLGDRLVETVVGAIIGVAAVLLARRFVEHVPMPPPTAATPSIRPMEEP